MSVYQVQQLEGAKKLALTRRELPTPAAGQVLLKIKVAGICGSDMEYYHHGFCGGFVPRGPLVLGHEFTGEVVSLGAGVTSLPRGAAVVVDPSMPCGACNYCRAGRYNLCTAMKFFGSASCYPHLDGGFAEYALVPAANCFTFDPQQLSWQEATLVEPLMVALAAVEKIERLPTRNVVVFGGGTIGQLILASLQALGARSCSLVDPRQAALDFAARRAVSCYTPAQLGERNFDVCIEASGHPQALLACYHRCVRGGTIIQVGTITGEVSLPANLVMSKELTVRGSFRYAHLFDAALQLLVGGRLAVRDLITHTLPLSQLEEGFRLALSSEVNTLKVQIIPD